MKISASLVLLFALASTSLALPRPHRNGERIIGGQQAERNQFPYMAQLQFLNQHQCGGAVIAPNWIVTVAHCVPAGTIAISYNVVANQYDILAADGMEKRQIAQRLVRHPQYNSTSISNDIALVRVNTPFYNVNDTVVRPIALPRQNHDAVQDRLATVSGWGITSEGGTIPPRYLRFVEVPVVNDTTCRASYGDTIFDSMICAGYPEGQKDACNGDSGGPLVCQDSDDGDAYLCGLVSWGNGCARPYFYGVYTEVSAFADWIQNNID